MRSAPSRSTPPPGYRHHVTRGQSLTELALIVPVLVAMLIGMVDLSGGFMARMNVQASAAQGTRIGALEGAGRNCNTYPVSDTVDLDVIDAVLGGNGVDRNSVQSIQVYRVQPDGRADTSAVNTYVPPFTQTVNGATIPVSATNGFNWPPCTRQQNEPSDSIGVHVAFRYHPIVALPGLSALPIDVTADQHLNPTAGSVPCPIPGIPRNLIVQTDPPNEPPPTTHDRLTWNVVPGADSYNIYASVNGAGYGASPAVSVTAATGTGVVTQTYVYTGNTTYAPANYELTGVNFCGEGSRSLPQNNGQCDLPFPLQVISATQIITMPPTDIVTWTAPLATAPLSSTYLITGTDLSGNVITESVPITSGTQSGAPPLTPVAGGTGTVVPPQATVTPQSTPQGTPSPSGSPTPLTVSATITASAGISETYQVVMVNRCGVLSPNGTPIARVNPTPTNTATATPTNTATATPTSTPTSTATATPTGTPTGTPLPTSTPTKTATSTPVPTATPTQTATSTPVPTATPTQTATITPVPTATRTATPLPTNTATNTATNTSLPTATSTNTATNTPVPTATSTNTPVPTATSTNTPVPTATSTNTPVPTATSTNTPVPTAIKTPVPTATQTPVPVPTATRTPESIFTTQTPASPNTNFGQAYEIGVKFRARVAGQITGIRYYAAPGEYSTMHTGRLWDSNGNQLASVVFAGETASGWQTAMLSSPVAILANTTYVVSVNTHGYVAVTTGGLQTSVTNGDLYTVADGNNGVYGNAGSFPTAGYQSDNPFRDVIFVPTG